jgi:hypothetical protein
VSDVGLPTIYVYFRRGQRRLDPATDGDFCLTRDETGQQFPPNTAPIGEPKSVSRAVLDARTVVVKPWWLYADYRAAVPTDLTPEWAKRFPGFFAIEPRRYLGDGEVVEKMLV